MKFVRFLYQDEPRFALVKHDRVVLLEGSPFTAYAETSVSYQVDAVQLCAPCEPSKVVCIGLNYRDHALECNLPIPDSPIIFMKPSGTVIGPGDAVVHPALSGRVDYEGELAIVIGKQASKVSEEAAHEYILGYTCANDVTARDLQPPKGQWTVSKSFDTFCPLGPVITDEIDPDQVDITTKLQGRVVQSSNTRNLIFKPAFLVSYISQVMTLYPQDVIITGTPSGIGPMKPGDVVEVHIAGIGVLKNRVVGER